MKRNRQLEQSKQLIKSLYTREREREMGEISGNFCCKHFSTTGKAAPPSRLGNVIGFTTVLRLFEKKIVYLKGYLKKIKKNIARPFHKILDKYLYEVFHGSRIREIIHVQTRFA